MFTDWDDMPFDTDDDFAFDTDEAEYFFTCPYCWSEISMLLDPFVREQTYVEDCEVCCNPIEIRYRVEWGEISEFSAAKLGQ